MSTYKIDAAHSEIHFKVKHLMITTVTGSFEKFDATLETSSEEFNDAKISFEADIDSINTNQKQRDTHLKSAEFFDAENHPKLSFVSTSFLKKRDNEFTLNGDLTIRGVTKPVALDVEYGGSVNNLYGQNTLGFEITGKISRKEFGITWNAPTEAGGVVVSDEVKLLMNVQMIKQG